jgi:hypothetical protein
MTNRRLECCVSHSSPKQGLNGAPQPSLPVQEQGHCSLNLPQASWLLGMTKLRAVAHLGMVGGGWTE